MKQFFFKSWLMLCLLLVGIGTSYADVVTETFENQSDGTTYNGDITYEASASNAGISWYVEHGTVSKTAVITGTQSLHMRAYYASSSAAGKWNGALPYAVTKTPIKGLQSFTFSAAVSNTGLKMDVYYSTNGTSWTQIGTTKTFSNTTAANAGTFNIPASDASTNYYIKIAASSSSTHAASPKNAGNYTFRIDDVEFTYSGASSPEPTTYTVTFNAGTNGTCSTSSLTEASAGAGVTLPSCSSNTNYTFQGWSTSSTPTSANAGSAGDNYKPSSDCTLYAYYTYQAPTHDAKFFVNGQQYGETQLVAEGSAITFPTNKPSIDDVAFIGWAESEISGTQDKAPTLVTSKNMGNANVNFYAVFATAEGVVGEPENKNMSFSLGSTMPTGWTTNADNKASGYIRLKEGQYAQADVVTSAMVPGDKVLSSDYISVVVSVGTFGTWTGTTKSVKITIDLLDANQNVLSTNNQTFSGLTSSESAEKAAIAVNKPSDPSKIKYLRVTASDHGGGSEIRLKYVKPSYSIAANVTYSDYCTSVSGKSTATLLIADADKNVAIGYNGTKNVSISVSEQNYDGTLSVVSTNESVATVSYSGTTATITYVGEGTAYISVTAPSTANYYAINQLQAIKITATDARNVADVTIDPATISVDNGSNAEYTVTTAYNGTISAVSKNTSVATVSYGAGKVTVEGQSVGSTVLTISGEGTATYKPFSKDFTITVNKVVPVGIKNLRTQITSTNSSNQDNVEARLVDAVVTYVSTGNTPTIYLEDAEAGIVIYAKNTNLAVGDKLNGVISGKGYIYSGLTELTSITGFEKTTGAVVPCTEVTLAQLEEDGMEAWESRRVIVKNLSITSAMSSRNATVEQNGVSITVNEKASAGCTGEKLSSTDYSVASIVGYFQDYNSNKQISVWSGADITLAEKAVSQVVFNLAAGTGTNENPIAFTIGEDNTFPTAVVKDGEGNAIAGAAVTYSTTNDAYISVDAETGVLTLIKYASKSNNVHVTATFAGNAQYKSASADYYLTIGKGTPVISFSEPTVSVALDAASAGQAVSVTKGSNLTIKYTSSNPAVASFANENNPALTLNAEGTTIISAQSVTNDTWKQSNKVSYTLTVTAPAAGYAYVTLDACGNTVEGYTEPIKVAKGRTITLPDASTTADGYTFQGWTSAGEVAKTTTAPSMVATNYIVSANVTLYPVFKISEEDGSSTELGWVLKGLDEIDFNETVLIASTSATATRIISAENATQSYYLGRDVTIENGVLSGEPDKSDWIIANEGGNYSFTSNNNGYLYNKGCSYNNYERWALTANGEKTYSMESLGGSPYTHSGSYVYLDNNNWAMTTTASLSKIQFFQYDEYSVPGSSTDYYVSATKVLLGSVTSTSTDYYSFAASEKFTIPAGVTAYFGTLSENSIQLTEVSGNVDNYEGVVFKGEVGKTYKFYEYAGDEVITTENDFVGASEATSPNQVTYDYYVLAKADEMEQGFYHYTGTKVIPAHKAYIEVNKNKVQGGAPARLSLVVDGTDVATNLDTFETEKVEKFFESGHFYILKSGRVYDVTGRLVK